MAFHLPVAIHHHATELGKLRTTTATPTRCRCHQRFNKSLIGRLNKQPGTALAHDHFACGSRNGAGAADGIEQVGLARPDGDAGAKQHPQAGAGRGIMARFLGHLGEENNG